MKMPKFIWKSILIFTAAIFIYSLLTKQIWLTVVALGLSFIIGKQNLFAEYDKKQAAKRKKFQNMMIERKNKNRKEKLK